MIETTLYLSMKINNQNRFKLKWNILERITIKRYKIQLNILWTIFIAINLHLFSNALEMNPFIFFLNHRNVLYHFNHIAIIIYKKFSCIFINIIFFFLSMDVTFVQWMKCIQSIDTTFGLIVDEKKKEILDEIYI